MGYLSSIKASVLDAYHSIPPLRAPAPPAQVEAAHVLLFSAMLFIIVASYNSPKIAHAVIGTPAGRLLSLVLVLLAGLKDVSLGLLAGFTWVGLWYICRNYDGSDTHRRDGLARANYDLKAAKFGSDVLDIELAKKGFTTTPKPRMMYPSGRPLLAYPPTQARLDLLSNGGAINLGRL